jgi:hypothetical protein
MKLLLENWRKYLNEEQEGEGVLLYHATCSPPESFASGIDPTIAKGYGQGEGFFFWTSRKRAVHHARSILLPGEQKEQSADCSLGAFIVVSDEPVTPETFDIDYEAYAEGFAKFMIDNLQYFAENMKVFGMDTPWPMRRKTAEEIFLKPPHQFLVTGVEMEPVIKLKWLAQGRETNTYAAEALSQVAKELAEFDSEMFKNFEQEILPKATAVKYNGKERPIPLRIEDLEGNVVWSRE